MFEESILLLEGDTELRVRITDALRAADFQVEPAAEREAVLSRVCESSVAIVIAGLDLEDEAQAGLPRAIADASPQTECIVLTDSADWSRLAALYESSCVCAHHPRRFDSIAAIGRDLARALAYRRARRQNARLLIELRDARDELQAHAGSLAGCEQLAALGVVVRDASTELASSLADMRRGLAAIRSAMARGSFSGQSIEDLRATPEIEAEADRIDRIASECQTTIETIHRFGQSDTLEREALDIGELIYSAFGVLAHTFSARGIRVRASLASDVPPVFGSRALLRQAFVHLALNSVGAMPNGGTIFVSTAVPEAGEGVRIEVRDTGGGIPAEVRDRVFEPFFTTGARGRSTGLGLAVVRRIVHELGGDITLESEEGRGAAFRVVLPLAAEAAVPSPVTLEIAA